MEFKILNYFMHKKSFIVYYLGLHFQNFLQTKKGMQMSKMY